MRELLLSAFNLAYLKIKFNFGPYTNMYALNYLVYSLYLVARMELLTRFLLNWVVPYLLGYSPWISSMHPVYGQYYIGVTSFLLLYENLEFFSCDLTACVSSTWDFESMLSTLAFFFGCLGASFIGVYKISLVRFNPPRESTQETRRMALEPL